MNLEEYISIPPYSLDKSQKEVLLNNLLRDLTLHHYHTCVEYRKMLDAVGFDPNQPFSYQHLPFLPVRLFKMLDLKSIPDSEVAKTMTSSGTTGQAVSKIYLDRDTAASQTKVLTKIVSSFIGKQRVPMLIIDSESVVKDRRLFSARGAGILGFSMFGTQRVFALNNQMELDVEAVAAFLLKNQGGPVFMFGFTFMVWQHFYKELIKQNIHFDLSKAVLIHGGGWKKLAHESVSSEIFKQKLFESTGIQHVHDYYGMVEQTGSIYMECGEGHLHAPIFSDVIIRRYTDFSEASIGEKGIIQVVSVLPKSYPGHSLLTEDEGILLGEDDCRCGRKGKYFKIIGRVKNAEIRGCSDVYATRF